MATSRVRQKIFCSGTQAKILVPSLKFNHCEPNGDLVANGGNFRAGNSRDYHASLHASKSDQFLALNAAENIVFRENQLEGKSVSKSLKSITGQLGAQVLQKAYKLSNNIIEWANNLNNPTAVDKPTRLARRCRSCDPRHLKSAEVETTRLKGSNRLPNRRFGSAVEAIKSPLRDDLNSSFYRVLSTQSHRGYSKLQGTPADSVKDTNEKAQINHVYLNGESNRAEEKSIMQSDDESEHARNFKEQTTKQKCYPLSRNFSFAFFQPPSTAHFFTTLSPCQLDTGFNESPATLFAPQYLSIEQNLIGRINESRETTIAVGNALVNKARGIHEKVFKIALLSSYQDIEQTRTVNEKFLNKLICSCKTFLGPSLSTVNIDGRELAASKSLFSKGNNGDSNLVSIKASNEEEETDERNFDGVVTIEGKVFDTNDETLNKLLLLVKQTKIAQENCLEAPILDQILSPSMLKRRVEEKIDLLSSSVRDSSSSDMKPNPVSYMNYSTNDDDLKFCGNFFSEDVTGDVEFENLKVRPPVSERSVYRVLKAFKDIVREDSNSFINSHYFQSQAATNSVDVNESINRSEASKDSHSPEIITESCKLDEKQFGIDEKFIDRFTTSTDLIKFGEHIGKSYPTFFQSIPQRNSEIMLQCNSMRLHSFIANYNPNIRRASNLANNSNMHFQSNGLTKNHQILFQPTQNNKLMRVADSSRVGKKWNRNKKITSQVLMKILNENLNLKTKTNEFSENINLYNLYENRFDKLREVIVSRESSTYKSLLAGSSSLKVFSEANKKIEPVKLSKKTTNPKTSLNLNKVVFKPRSVGTVISSLDSNSAQFNPNKNLNMNNIVSSENNSDYFKAVSKENEITRINKLNKLSKKLASSTKNQVRYSWKNSNVTPSSFTVSNNGENTSKLKNVDGKLNSHLPLKSNNLKIFKSDKKRTFEGLDGKENFHGKRQFGIFNSVNSNRYLNDTPKVKPFSFNSSLLKNNSEDDASNHGFSRIDKSGVSELSTQQSSSKNGHKSSIAEPKMRVKGNSLLNVVDFSGERKIAFDDKEQIESFKFMKTDKQSDGVTKLNSYARKLRHSIKYGSVFSDLDKSSAKMKPANSLVAAMNLRGTEKKAAKKSSLIGEHRQGSNTFRIPDTRDLVLQRDQVENIKERLISDRSKMSDLYKEPAQHGLNLLDREFVLAKTGETETNNGGGKYFANFFKKDGSRGGSGSDRKPSNKNNKKNDSSDKKVKNIERKHSNLASNNVGKYGSSRSSFGGNENGDYKSDNNIFMNKQNTSSGSLRGPNRPSSIDLMRSVKTDKPSKSLSAEFLVRPYPKSYMKKESNLPRLSIEKPKVNFENSNRSSGFNNDKNRKISNEVGEKQIENSSSVFSSRDTNNSGFDKVGEKLMENSSSLFSSRNTNNLIQGLNRDKTVFNAGEKKVLSVLKAGETMKNERSKNEYITEENRLKKESISKVEEKQKSSQIDSRGRSNSIESFMRSESRGNQGYTYLKQEHNEDVLKYDNNKKFFTEKASVALLPDSKTKSLNDRVEREKKIDVERNETSNRSRQSNILSDLWPRDDNKKVMSIQRVGSNSLEKAGSSPSKNQQAKGESSLFFKSYDGSKDKFFSPQRSAFLGSKPAERFVFQPNVQNRVSSPDNTSNTKNEKLSASNQETENLSKQREAKSDKPHLVNSSRPVSSPEHINSLYRSILTKDRKDGEMRGLEARGLEYSRKKQTAEKTDKETQTPPIVEKPKSKKVRNDKVAGGAANHFSKSLLKSAAKDVRKTEDVPSNFQNKPTRVVFKDSVEDTKISDEVTNAAQSVKYLERKDFSNNSDGQDGKQNIFEPEVGGFQTMRVFASRKKENEKKDFFHIESLENEKEIFRTPLSLTKRIQTKRI